MANLLDLVDKIRNSFSDNQGWFRGGKFTPGQQIKDVQASSPVKSFGPLIVPNMKNQQTAQFYNQFSTPQGQAKFNETPVTNPIQGIGSYIGNRYIAPIKQIPYNINQVIGKNKSLGERGMGLLNLAGGTVAMIPDPVGDVALPVYDYWKGVKAAQQRGEGTLQSYKTGLTALTGQKPVGLGEAVTKNQTAQNILNLAELPLIIGATGKVNSVQKARKLVLDEAANIISSVNANKHFYAYEPILQREIMTNLDDLGKKLIPKIVNSKEMKDLSLRSPQQWRNLVSEYLQDRLMSAKNPELNVGFNTRNLKRIPEEELAKGVGGEISKTRAVDSNRHPLQETVRLDQKLSQPENLANIKIKQTPPQTEVPLTTDGGPQISQPTVPLPDSTIDPVQKIINALKKASPLNKEQQQIYAQIRSKQAGKIAGMQENLKGEAGFRAELGALKGEMPKVQFEAIKESIGQADIDTLFNRIKSSNLTPFEKISAQAEFEKLLNGSVPTKSGLRLLNEVFPPEFIQTVLDKRTKFQKLTSVAENIINIPRSVMATGDLSAPLRQGIFLIGRPKQWIPAFKEMFKYAFNKEAYKGYDAIIKSDPNYKLMREAKLAITDMGDDLLSREEAFMSNLPEKIPGLGKIAAGSNRAYTGFLNKLRVDTFNDLISKAKAQGVELNEQTLKNIGSFVNNATGRGDLGTFSKAASLLNATFFSPRLMFSRLNLLNPVYYAKLDPFTRKEAMKSLFTFAGTVGSILGLAKLSGAEVGTDPRSADFGKIKIGNTRYDIAGGFSQYLRLAAQLITGRLISSTTGKEYILGDKDAYNPLNRKDIFLRFIESKEAPAMAFLTALMTGKNAIGEDFDLPVEVLNRMTPMMIQDLYDLYKEWGPEGLIMGIPGIFGIGSQTYGKQIPNLEVTPSGTPTIKLRSMPGLSEDIVSKVTGKQYSNIPLDQQQPLAIKIQAEKQAKVDADKLKKQLESGKVDSATKEQVQSAPDLKTAKLFFEYSDAKSTKVGNTYLYKNDKGDIKTLDLTPIKEPTLTGDYNLDKSLKSKYNSAISTQVSGIVDLYNMGELSQEEATKMVNTLTNQKIGGSGAKKAKKISIAKVSVPKVSYKIRKSPKRQLAGAKIVKRPNLKPVKTKNIKVAQLKVPEGNIKIAKPKTIRLT